MNHWLGRLSFRGKFLLLALLALAMLGVPTGLHVMDTLGQWHQAKAERAGMAPLAESLKVLRLTQQHRGLSNAALGGNADSEAQRQKAGEAMVAAFGATEAALKTAGHEDNIAALGELGKRAAALRQAVGAKSMAAPQSFAQHTQLIEDEMALIYQLSVESELVLHPKATGYFLQDAVFRSLPALSETMGRMRGAGMGLLTRGDASATERSNLKALITLAQAQAKEIQRSIQFAGSEAPQVKARLASLESESQQAITKALALVESKVVAADALDYPPAQYWSEVTQAIDTQFKLADQAAEALRDDLTHNEAQIQRTALVAVVAVGGLLVVGLWLMTAISKQTTQSLRQAVQLAEAVAEGDLSQRVQAHGQDEVAQLMRALERMTGSLSSVVASVRGNAEQVATASAQIAQGNQDLSSRTEAQASSLQQTAASMDELGSTVTQNADNARQANQLAQGASEVATRGGEAVGEVVTTMRHISESARQIADIIGTIDGIAFQTNILALNAAVEAARAGEQGRGFAVVAAEVRNLAQRSAEAAKEIKQLITASVERVEQGSQQVDRAGATMDEIVQSIRRVSDIMGEISTASSEQSSGVSQVGQAMSQMDQATQQNAALVEQSAAAAESLRSQAMELHRAVSAFKLPQGGYAAA